jgi:hypothetical protein
MSTLRLKAPLVAATLSMVVLSGCSSDPEPTVATDSPDPTTSTSPSVTESPDGDDPSGTPTATPSGTSAVPVYFVGDTPQGARLFREFQSSTEEPLKAALKAVDGGTALDADYRTLWPGGTVASVSIDDDEIEVDLNGDAFTEAPDGMTRADANLAIQQMVYSLQAASQTTLPVQFDRDNGPDRLFGIDVSQPVERGDWLDVLAMVNVTTPAEGAVVTGDTLEASGVGSSFEATIPWRMMQGDKVVLENSAMADGWMDKLCPWEVSIDISELAPGEYVFVAATDDPSEGEGGGPTEDTKNFTVS